MPALLALLALTLAACGATPGTPPSAEAPPPPSDASGPVVRADTTLPRALATRAVDETPIVIRLADLPEPYASESASRGPNVIAPPASPVLNVPPGFAVQLWADGLDAPRWLATTPDGAVLVVASRENRILRLADANGDGVAEARAVLADRRDGLDLPMGVAFGDADTSGAADLFVGNTSEVRRYRYRPEQPINGPGERVTDLPGRGYNQHWTRNVVRHGDSLYVTVGSQSNVDPEPLPRASVFRMALDGSGRETVSFGLRNPVGLAFHPATGAPYTTVNERDRLGDDLVPDYLTRIGFEDTPRGPKPRFFGWPYAYLAPDRLDPRRTDRRGTSEQPALAARTTTPDVLFQAHSAALGLDFVPLDAGWPARYRGGAVVAMRGSWNRSAGTGYKLVFVPFRDGRPTGAYQDLVTGFLVDPSGPTAWARPVGVLALPDGSVLFTDEANGRVYRLSYVG